ncbi:MAG: tRNA (adenosine(37)-N6)-threonylcarbamoyltransferase complex ATPase subunit type 1 TsaE [Clostridiaceae bacterium]|nr:tRNA (adenosine(37)-N6)-threonylcarbamoyltransferase complex ATPase subunit type 1 TsaE [Clostridiaceae bacterium]
MMYITPLSSANPAVWTALCDSPEATGLLGRRLAGYLSADDVISLEGDMGAGKTAFTRGLAAGLHCRGTVASPTFTLLMEHPAGAGGLALYHFDTYRLSGAEEFCELGLQEYFTAGGVCVLEWGDLVADILPPLALVIRFSQIDFNRPQTRLITITWPAGEAKLAAVTRDLLQNADQAVLCEEGSPC